MQNPLFEDSYARLFGSGIHSGNSDYFFERFYQHFLSVPEVASLFANTDMKQQVAMLKRSLFHLTTFYVTSVPSAQLQQMAQVHRALDVQPDMFDDWLNALVETVIELDVAADESTKLAWCWALSPGITYMRLALHASDPWPNETS